MTNSTPHKRPRGRPPKNSRNTADTKALLLRSGLEMLTEQGFMASGLDQILKRVGIPKGSFYHYFASKEAFGLEVLASYDRYFAKKLDKHLLNTDHSPIERLARFVEDAKKGMVRYQFQRGCLVGNLEQEVPYLPESFRPQVLAVFRHWQHKVAACLGEAQAQGAIDEQADCEALAEFFWIGWEGSVSRAKLVQSVEPLDRFFNHFRLSITQF